MSQIHSDPEKLREFAGELKRFAAVVDEQMSALKSHLGRLGDTWRDQEFESFIHEFASAQNLLKNFVEETRRTAPLLERDAEALEDFQRLKPQR
jgi:uncharacterized protein YukE